MTRSKSGFGLVWVLLGLVMCLGQSSSSAQNLILNGDFENTGATTNTYNMSNALFNALVNNATAFGTGQEIDLMTTDTTYGPPPQSGLWKAAIHKAGYPNSGTDDAFSFTLSAPVVAGQQYALSFYAQDIMLFDVGAGAVQVGVSGSPTDFGALVFSGTPETNAWTHLSGTFTAPLGGGYLTVQVDPGANPTWAHIDNFSLTVVPEPGTFTLLVGAALVAALGRKGRNG